MFTSREHALDCRLHLTNDAVPDYCDRGSQDKSWSLDAASDMPMMAIIARRPLASSALSFLALQTASMMQKVAQGRSESRWLMMIRSHVMSLRPEGRVLDGVAETDETESQIALAKIACRHLPA